MLINRSVNFFAAGRALHVIVATALLTASLAARAADDARMDACIEAFVAASLPKDQPIRVLKSGPSPRALGAPSRGYQIVLTATGTSTGKRFARATCTVGRDGAVMAMNGKLIRIRTADAVVSAAEKAAAR
jgi:hypothetical protein